MNHSFALNIFLLNLYGLYPSDDPSKFSKTKALALYIIFCLPMYSTVLIKFLVHDGDANQTSITVVYLATVAGVVLKLPTFLVKAQKIKKCIKYFEDDRFRLKDSVEKGLMEDCTRICRRNTKIFFMVTAFTVEFWLTLSLFAHKLPVEVWLPYDASKPIPFYLTYVFIYLACTYNLFVEILVDPLIGGLAFHATTQLKILKYNLQNLVTHSDDLTLINHDQVRTYLNECIQRHDLILRFVAEYEDCFSLIMFFQFAGSMLTICFALIELLQVTELTADTAQFVGVFFCATFQILFYCFYGTLLYEENEGFIQAIYMGQWYRYDVKIRKALITMMERSKTPMILSAGKVMDVTLQTFAAVLKTSYSLIAVLK